MDLESLTLPPAKSVSELIDYAERLAEPKSSENDGGWAFRGQPREYRSLLPSFRRQVSRRSYGTAELIESKLINAFREHYRKLDDLGQDMPKPDTIGPGWDLRCLSVMQHYEIPTRLLDWTTDFWTGVYFACASDPDSSGELWYYNRSIFEPQRQAEPTLDAFVDRSSMPSAEPEFLSLRANNFLIELDIEVSPRMKRQFAHHTVSADVFADHAPLLDQLQRKANPESASLPQFLRLPIDGTCKGKVLDFLNTHKGITASTVFPDVVGLGRFLRWQFDALRTMLL